ncbi:hypothetical protein [Streptomyces corynorhini]|uniref:hypothetical protein n=1 Tax=Streptomyces corynorhini TaxID=2282652 RepID=UPI0018F3474C|nr:hypothetical protein [Streptomyces corynorhini]
MTDSAPLPRPSRYAHELLTRFTEPESRFGPLPIWWWSGATITREELRRQLREMVSQGIRQAVVMCLAPTGPMFGSLADDPPFLSPRWLALLDTACADAEELGFRLWIYDQIGFSGANFQGRLTAERPEFAGLALHRSTLSCAGDGESVLAPPEGHTALAAYARLGPGTPRVGVPLVDGTARWSGAPAHLTLVHSGTRGFDYFGEDACAALLDQVHGTLERRVGHWFGRAIGGFFQDELPAMPTWGRDFAETFTARYGYDPLPLLWALWDDGTDGTDGTDGGGPHDAGPDGGTDAEAARFRRDYHAHRARLGRRGFFDRLDAWFARHGLVCGFDQPSPAREGDPCGGVEVYGDYLATHRGYGAPGSDHWGDPKVHSSLAHARGHERTWIEAFHSTGWGGTLEETYDWLAPLLRRGATLYDPHAVYYSTAGGWWEWAAPSTCWRQPYWPSYHVFSGAVARLCSVLTAGTHVCDTALLSPTTTAQAYQRLDGPLAPARAAAAAYHRLNGRSAWYAEERGSLERAGIDHDVLDETTLAAGTVDAAAPGGPGLRVGDEIYRTVVVPPVRALHVRAARTLARFAAAGGRVIHVGGAPELFLGEESGGGTYEESAAEAFAAALARGALVRAETADQVPGAVVSGPVRVRADAPFLLRRYGDCHVLTLVAHDERSGTAAPVVSLETGDWWTGGFPWEAYWEQLRTTGYRFRPAGARRARVRVAGLGRDRPRAQRWDPGTGHRTELPVVAGPDGQWLLDVGFEDGPVALVVLARALPAPTREPLGEESDSLPVEGPWKALATSTLDNSRGDLAAADRTGILPIEVWRMDHLTAGAGESEDGVECRRPGGVPGPAADWRPVVAGYGPFALVRGPWTGSEPPADGWRPVEWSLSRGIRDDPAHAEALGPKGYVPEEFLDWRRVPKGGRVAVRTHLALPDRDGLYLAVGANAARRITVDGAPVTVRDSGYQSFSLLPPRAAGHTVELEIELEAVVEGPVRASFAVVRGPLAYRRPAWLEAGDDRAAAVGEIRDLVFRARLDRLPPDCTVQVGSDGPCGVFVNGVEIGRQGDFNPYPGHREIRIHPYGIRDWLRVGENTLTLRVTRAAGTAAGTPAGTAAGTPDGTADGSAEPPPAPTAVVLDSAPGPRGGLGWTSGPGWRAFRGDERVPVRARLAGPRDPRFVCAWARPHPLPGAHWLEPAAAPGGVVEPLVPDLSPGGERTEWLRLNAPLGTTSLRLPTSLPVTVLVAGEEYAAVAGRVVLRRPLAAGTPVYLRVTAADGRRGGALLDTAVSAEVAEVTAPLASWEELGLRSLGGEVRYRTAVRAPERWFRHPAAGTGGGRTLLDLGEVRGCADVTVNGTLTGRLVWSPWTSDVTDALRPGENRIEIVVRGTLAGYLDDASPTGAVVAGQIRTGLFGPVRLVRHAPPAADLVRART